jgi:Ca2+-binding EF-hand superfamily protein
LAIGKANVPGFWVVPKSEIDAVIEQERRRRREEKLHQIATVEARQKTLLTRYDRNHNGAIDPEEKAEAIDDPAFLEVELKTIDADQNGRLEAGELNYFDSNNNGILDSKEQAGIAAVQRLLADKIVEEFDTDKDRLLDRAEFAALPGNASQTGFSIRDDPIQFDSNHDGKLDLDELTSFLMQQTRRSLIAPGAPRALPERGGMRGAAGREASFWLKPDVEAYWKRHGPSGNAPADPVKSPGTAATRLPAP